jgi:2-aminoadipate transaminase
MELDWSSHLAPRTAGMQSSAIREILKLTGQPGVISFAGGLPASEFFPLEEIEAACCAIIRQDGNRALQYTVTEGHPPLKAYLAAKMSERGEPVAPENILMVNGSQQGLDLIGKLFLDAGDTVIVSRPTYLGAIQAWNAYEARYQTVSLDDDGMVVDEIEQAYERTLAETGRPPKFVYVLPNFQNPAGTTLPLERRRRLAEVAAKLDIPVIEDDPYGQLRYEGEEMAPIYAAIPERTVYLSTFSKTLTPGLRLGWIICDEALIRRFVQAKQGCDLHTGTLAQYIAGNICEQGLLEPHIERLRVLYKERRDTMLDALAEFWPEGCSWTRPEGGLFLWAQVPESIDTNAFLKVAVKEKVAFVPGINFYAHRDGGHSCMRLNFSYCSPDTIVEGVRRLGVALKRALMDF